MGAQLLGGWSTEKVLAMARERFLCVSAEKILRKDMANNKPDPALSAFTQSSKLGHVDVFVSHSWHDDAEAKWNLLQEWREDFKKLHSREPTIWMDKYCIDQNNIDESLACLP